MSRADGAVLGTTRLVDNGRPQRRWNVTILGDGFTTAEMPAYEAAALNAANTLFSLEPFSLIRRSINVFRVNVRSDVSGVTVNPGCGGTATRRQTFFNGSFCHSGLPRLTAVDNGLAWDIAREQVPQTHVVLVILNSTMFGGAGGSVATCSLASGAAALALHELCHSAFGLADEYESWRGCGVDTDRNVHGFTALNLVEPNVTVHEDLEDLIQHKWGRFVNSTIGFPVMRNPDCSQCNPNGSPFPARTVGLFEGAHYYHCDAHRPEFTCIMRSLGAGFFCRACREHILQRLAPFVSTPLEDLQQWDLVFISRQSGRVMDVEGASPANSAPIQIYDYHGGNNQRWRVMPLGNNQWRIQSVGSGRVLDVWGISRRPGAPIHQYDWWDGANQKWAVDDAGDGYRILTSLHSGLVIDVAGARTENGTDLVQWGPTGGDNQSWRVSTAELGLFVRHTGKALDVSGLSHDNGAPIIQWDWWAGRNQQWRLEDVGRGYFRIVSAESGKVLDVRDGGRRNGAQVIQWDWHAADNQQWRLEPAGGGFYAVVARHSGLCLEVLSISGHNGARVGTWTFVGGWNQLWRIAPAP